LRRPSLGHDDRRGDRSRDGKCDDERATPEAARRVALGRDEVDAPRDLGRCIDPRRAQLSDDITLRHGEPPRV
jgi:hypothetical protein